MNPALIFRRAQVTEAELLTAMVDAGKRYWGYPAEWMAEWRAELTVTPEYIGTQPVVVAEWESQVVGFFGLVLTDRQCRLEHLWLRPAHIGRGFGRALFAEAVRHARTAGIAELQIKSDPNAEGFYLKMGAVRIGADEYRMPGGELRSVPVLSFVTTLD